MKKYALSKKPLQALLIVLVMACFIPSARAATAEAASEKALSDAFTAYNIGDYKKTLRLITPLAQNGNVRAQVLLGRCCENGLGMEQNLEMAAQWYGLAAKQNDSEAQVLLAYCYEIGAGVPQDTLSAIRLMDAAAHAGNAEAQFNLALYFGQGRYNVPKIPEDSFLWAKRSADQGYAQAQRYVAACYEHGIGIKKDEAEAARWYAKAAALGLEKDGAVFTKKQEYVRP